MSFSATQARRGSWIEVLAVVTVILGMLGGVGAVTATPAQAADCGDQGTFDLHRLLLEFGGTADGTRDGTAYLDTDVDPWCYDGNDIIFTGHTPALHISCSQDLKGITVTGPGVPGGSAVVTEFWLDSRNPANNNPNRELCQDESTFPEPEPDPVPAISLVKDAVVGDGSDLLAGDVHPFLAFSPVDDEGPKTALYSYTITNTGDEALVNLSLSDDRLGAVDLSDCPAVLAVGASCTATGSEDFTVDDAPASITNTGTVTADGQESDEQVTDDDPATINLLLTFDPAISLVKDAVVGDGSDLVAGDVHPFLAFSPVDDEGPKTALYSYTITNTGDEALVNLSLSDDRLGAVDLSDCPEVLAVGASCTATGSEDFTVDDAPASITNTGIVTADGQESDEQVTDEDPATIDLLLTFDPAISLVKDAVVGDGSDLVAGGPNPELGFSSSDEGPKTALYSYTITNTGDEALVNLSLSDDRLGAVDLSDCPEVLAVGASCTATGSEDFTLADAEADADGLVTNTGTVTADGQASETQVTDTDPATIAFSVVFDQPPLEPDPIQIDLVKEVVAGAGDVEEVDGLPIVSWSQAEFENGDAKTVRYRFTITNVGPSTIVDVGLVDPMISDEPIIAKADGVTLEPGKSTVVEVDHKLTVDEAFPDGPIATKVDNVASVSGANETRDAFSQDTDDASVFTEVVFAEVLEKDEPLPATGLEAGGLLPVSVLLIAIGAAILWLDRRHPVMR